MQLPLVSDKLSQEIPHLQYTSSVPTNAGLSTHHRRSRRPKTHHQLPQSPARYRCYDAPSNHVYHTLPSQSLHPSPTTHAPFEEKVHAIQIDLFFQPANNSFL